jgi:hypothetical protein
VDEIIINRIESIKVLNKINWQDAKNFTCSVELTLKGSQKVIQRDLKITINIRPVPSQSEIIKVIQNVNYYLYPEINQAQLSYGNNIGLMYVSLVFNLDWN